MFAPDDEMSKDILPGDKQSRASQWRSCASGLPHASIHMIHRGYV